MSFNKAVLRTYAQLDNPQNLPPNVYFTHTEYTIAIFDAYPKATFHFLIIPRVKHKGGGGGGPLSASNLTSLKNFLNSPQTSTQDANELLRHLKEDAEKVRVMIVEEMRSRYGFVWGIHLGFHAVQSMDHIHLHVISEDLCAPGLKTKKHYNSFHPKLGFFLHLEDVLSWFGEDKAESYKQSMIKLDESSYEKKLKEPLECFRCSKELKNIPALKSHLQEHFDVMAQKGKAAEADKKRKRDGDQTEENTGNAEERTDLDLKQEAEAATKKAVVASNSSIEASSKGKDSGSDSDAPLKRRKNA